MQDKAKPPGSDAPHAPPEELPYRVELWRSDGEEAVERVLGRAFNAQLAHAIYNAAQGEHPQRRIVLRRGTRVIQDTTQPGREADQA